MTAAGDVIARGFGHLLFSQVSSRVVTFVLNILVVRKLPPEIYGVAVIQFHLITTTILTFSREGVRRACLRGVQLGHKTESDLKSIIPLSWFCVPQGLVWSVVVCLFVLAFPGALEDRSYVAGVLLHGLAAFIESCSEPAYILSTCLLVFKLQLTVETLASLAKCFATLLFLVPGLQIPPLIAFGLAAMVYSTTLLIGYWAYFVYKGKLKDMISVQYLTLARVKDIDGGMLSAYASFTFQAIEKHFLGEGEKFVMAAFQPPYDQGVYGLVNNLGSIVVRTVFQPFEQAIFTAFSMSTKSKEGEEDSDSLKGQATLLTLILKLVFIFGGIFIAFGPSYSFTLI
jgi:oligosaccharide translocation protein RFT1